MRAPGIDSAARPPDLAAARGYCRDMLPRVSRTFALNIRILPGALGEAVLLAYLFCRIADTVEDSPHLPAHERPLRLAAYRNLFPLREGWWVEVAAWAHGFDALQSHGADHELCSRAAQVFAAFTAVPEAMRGPVEDCVREMTRGMQRFAERRAADPEGRLRLETLAELEEYCHYVAGTVGQMLCRLFAVSSPALDVGRLERMQRLAERFGLGLQLTNIVKDVAQDAQRGTCYVPRALAARYRLVPEQILDPESRPAAHAVMRELMALAATGLDAAVAFTLLIPRRETRLRLFCLWPIFLAARTLRRVGDDEKLFVPSARLRIGRGEVRRILGAAAVAVWSNRAIRRLYARVRPRWQAGPAES